MHGSICAVGTKSYLADRRSCSWSGRRLQCLWTHVVQIMNQIRKRIAIRNGFWNVILSFVNRPHIQPYLAPLPSSLGEAHALSLQRPSPCTPVVSCCSWYLMGTVSCNLFSRPSEIGSVLVIWGVTFFTFTSDRENKHRFKIHTICYVQSTLPKSNPSSGLKKRPSTERKFALICHFMWGQKQ